MAKKKAPIAIKTDLKNGRHTCTTDGTVFSLLVKNADECIITYLSEGTKKDLVTRTTTEHVGRMVRLGSFKINN